MTSGFKTKFFFVIVLFVPNLSAFSQAPNIEWQKCFGGTWWDTASSVEQTKDGGYVVAGYSESMDGDVIGNHGRDFWILKLDNIGNIQWQKCLGGSNWDYAESILQTNEADILSQVVRGRLMVT